MRVRWRGCWTHVEYARIKNSPGNFLHFLKLIQHLAGSPVIHKETKAESLPLHCLQRGFNAILLVGTERIPDDCIINCYYSSWKQK